MSLSEIKEIQMSEDGDNYVYEVYTEEACLGCVTIVLSKTRTAEQSTMINADSEWNVSSGRVMVGKTKLKNITDLYIYLRDTSTENVGTAVRVYSEPLELLQCYLTADGEMVLLPKRGESAYEFSKRLVLSYTDEYRYDRYFFIDLPNGRVGLEQLGLWKDTKLFTFQLAYYMEDEGAGVYGAPCQMTTIYIAPPNVLKTSYEEGKLTLSGDFSDGRNVKARFYQEGQLLKEVMLEGDDFSDKTLDISDAYADSGKNGYVEVCFFADRGDSFYVRAEVVLKEANMKSCHFEGDTVRITLEEQGVYEISGVGTEQIVCGSSFEVPYTVETVNVRRRSGFAYGPAASFEIKETAVYPFKSEQGVFYIACDRPDSISLTEDIQVVIDSSMEAVSPYTGTYFELQAQDDKTLLTVKNEIFTADSYDVRKDYKALLGHCAAQVKLYEEVKKAVKEKIPIRAEDMLFYWYDYCPEEGSVSIFEGMGISTEYTVYQNIPDARQSNADLCGFVGTGTAVYDVVKRDGKLKIEPFAGDMNFVVSPPLDVGNDNKLCGGAGVADLLYTGFAAAYMKLVYPTQFTDRKSVGNLCYDRNICLLSSDNPCIMESAAENMRKGMIVTEGVSYNYFRGRAVVVPKIRIVACGSVLEVSLGSRLCDVEKSMGLSGSTLYRIVGGQKLPVLRQDDQIPLLAGDCIEK